MISDSLFRTEAEDTRFLVALLEAFLCVCKGSDLLFGLSHLPTTKD